MTEEFENFIKTIKPEFGNENHLRAMEMIDKLRKKEKLLKEKLKTANAIKKLLREIELDERNIMHLIKSIKK